MAQVVRHGLSVQRAGQAVGLARATYYRPLIEWARRDAPVIAVLTTLVAAKSRWGFWKCFAWLRLDGHGWNHKRVWRVYCLLRLNLPRRTKKWLPARVRQPLTVVPQPNTVWALDFMSDTLYGRSVRNGCRCTTKNGSGDRRKFSVRTVSLTGKLTSRALYRIR